MERVTLVKDAIHNPSEPRHFMTFKPADGTFVALISDLEVARTTEAMIMHEVAHVIISPVIYFPEKDIKMEMFSQTVKTTHCPLKGDAHYHDYIGDPAIKDAIWCYPEPLSIAPMLRGHLAFDARNIVIRKLT